ncbi:MAG: HU family DNA-binding protein [Bacteroides sp.]
MPVLYSVRQSTIANKEGKKLYHPQVKTTGVVSLDLLAEEVAELSSLSTGDVKNSIDNLVTVMTRHMQSSESVLIDNLGSFYLSMKSVGKGFLTAEEVNANSCRLKVMFRPCTTRNSDRTVATRSLITGATFTRIDSLLPGSGTASDESGGSSSGTETPGGGSDADIE